MEEEPQLFYDPGPNRFAFFAGVIMPAISITVEATTHICANIFFDPIPTSWHLLLVIFVPLAQLQVWFALRRRQADRLALAGFLNSVTIGVSIFYAIVYLPLTPIALLALLFGLGLLPLAPFLSLLGSLIMRRQLKRLAATAPQRSFPSYVEPTSSRETRPDVRRQANTRAICGRRKAAGDLRE